MTKIKHNENRERRFFETELRIEKRKDESPVIIGHGAVFNSLSENLGGFREKIEPGAFDEVIENDVRALINHDSNLILARTKSGTLKLSTDSKGLGFEIDPPDTTYARDLLISLGRGDISQSSFSFSVKKDTWGEDENGDIVRTINKVARLFDVSPVTFPAYPDADVAKRSFDDYIKSKEPEIDAEKERIEGRIKEMNKSKF